MCQKIDWEIQLQAGRLESAGKTQSWGILLLHLYSYISVIFGVGIIFVEEIVLFILEKLF